MSTSLLLDSLRRAASQWNVVPMVWMGGGGRGRDRLRQPERWTSSSSSTCISRAMTGSGFLAHAQDALADGGTLLVVGHDTTNLTDGYGGPHDSTLLFTPEQVASDLAELRIMRADRMRRGVDTNEGHRVAIDVLVRAVKQRT